MCSYDYSPHRNLLIKFRRSYPYVYTLINKLLCLQYLFLVRQIELYILPLGNNMYPSGQSQWYVPTSFRQNPTPQMSGVSLHSSISKQIIYKTVTIRAHAVRSVYASYITITECTGIVESVSFVARTHVTAKSVGAMTIFTQIIVFFAFVNVFENHLFEIKRYK